MTGVILLQVMIVCGVGWIVVAIGYGSTFSQASWVIGVPAVATILPILGFFIPGAFFQHQECAPYSPWDSGLVEVASYFALFSILNQFLVPIYLVAGVWSAVRRRWWRAAYTMILPLINSAWWMFLFWVDTVHHGSYCGG